MENGELRIVLPAPQKLLLVVEGIEYDKIELLDNKKQFQKTKFTREHLTVALSSQTYTTICSSTLSDSYSTVVSDSSHPIVSVQ